LHFRDDEPGRFALIEAFGAQVADASQGAGEVFLYQCIASLPSSFVYENGEDRIVFSKCLLGGVETACLGCCEGKAVFGQIDGRLYQTGEAQLCITQLVKYAGDGARYAGREMPVLAEIRPRVAIGVEIHVAGGGSGCFFTVVERDIFSVGRMCDHEASSADVTCGGIYDCQYQLRRDRCIEGVATLTQHLHACMAGEGMCGDHGAVIHEGRLADGIVEGCLVVLGKSADRNEEKCAMDDKADERLPHTEERFTVSYHFSYIRPFMKINLLLPLGLLLSVCCCYSQTAPSPEAFLGYPLGAHFTPHHRVVEYFRAVAAAVPGRVQVEQYGTTYEGRPLVMAFIASPANLLRLESIRRNNLRLAGVLHDSAAPDEHAPVIVW